MNVSGAAEIWEAMHLNPRAAMEGYGSGGDEVRARCGAAYLPVFHTGRRFQSESTLQEIEIRHNMLDPISR
jgi:hypothetical protein